MEGHSDTTNASRLRTIRVRAPLDVDPVYYGGALQKRKGVWRGRYEVVAE